MLYLSKRGGRVAECTYRGREKLGRADGGVRWRSFWLKGEDGRTDGRRRVDEFSSVEAN